MKKLTNDIIIERLLDIYGDKYDYSIVNYLGINENIKIICPIHGVFSQTTKRLLQGNGCPFCNLKKLDKNILIEKFNDIHKYKYMIIL